MKANRILCLVLALVMVFSVVLPTTAFAEDEILSILTRASEAMDKDTRLYIMETFWDRQKYEPGALCLTMTSLYFTAIANGNSKMYHSECMERLVEKAGMKVETIHDNLGQGGHSIMVCKLK